MRLTSSDQRLSGIIDKVARENGLDGGQGRFKQYRLFQNRWTKADTMIGATRQKRMDMSVTDYLRVAPPYIVEEYVEAVMSGIMNREGVSLRCCSEEFSIYMDSESYIRRGQNIYLSRSHTLKEDAPDGLLHDVWDWLEERDLIPASDVDVKFCWDYAMRRQPETTTNLMFRIVQIPAVMNDRVSGVAADITWLVYRQLCGMATPFDPIGFSHMADANELYKLFPADLRRAAERQLQMSGLWSKDLLIQ